MNHFQCDIVTCGVTYSFQLVSLESVFFFSIKSRPLFVVQVAHSLTDLPELFLLFIPFHWARERMILVEQGEEGGSGGLSFVLEL